MTKYPLHSAAREGREDTVMQLIKEGADVNQKNDDKRTPVHEAASNAHTNIVRVLLKIGADCSIKDNRGEWPLFTATRKGAELNAKYCSSFEPETLIEVNKYRDVVSLLKAHEIYQKRQTEILKSVSDIKE